MKPRTLLALVGVLIFLALGSWKIYVFRAPGLGNWSMAAPSSVPSAVVEPASDEWDLEKQWRAAKTNPSSALDWISTRCPLIHRAQAIASLGEHWRNHIPPGGLEALTALSDKEVQVALVSYITSQKAKLGPAALKDWLGSLDRLLTLEATNYLKAAIPDLTFAEASSIGSALEGSRREDWLQAYAKFRMPTNLDQVLDWALSADRDTRDSVLSVALPKLAAVDIARAVQLTDAAELSVPFIARLRVAEQWAHTDPNSAIAWNENFGTEVERGILLRGVLKVVAESDPQAAMNALASVENTGLRTEASLDLLGVIAKHDPVLAASWAASLPVGRPLRLGATIVAREYLKTDWQASEDWLASLPPGPDRDAAMGEFVQDLQSRKPQEAFLYASKIDGDDERNRRASDALKAWAQRDPSGLEKWRSTHGSLNPPAQP